ncbi:MAG TPA: hypothetical protein VMB18_08420 [Terriglobales bacterium]|nr:hypothetical protein [Terriglobales bacterium]
MEIRDLSVFLDYFGKIHQRTMRVVRCIPPDKVDWSFRPGKFTVGDLARHISTATRYIFAETLQVTQADTAVADAIWLPLTTKLLS